MTPRKLPALLLVLIATGLAATACGRRAPLETPYEAAVRQAEEARRAGEPVEAEPEAPKKDKRFILDPLLD